MGSWQQNLGHVVARMKKKPTTNRHKPPSNGFVHPSRDQMVDAAQEQSSRHSRQQYSLAALSRAAVKRDDLSALISDAVKHVGDQLEVEHVQISELQAGDGTFALGPGSGWLLDALGAEQLAACLTPQSAFTIAAGEPVIAPDLSEEARFESSEGLRENGAASSMSVVIHPQPEMFGVLIVYAKRKRDFTNSDAMYLRTVANILAGAIQNDRAKRDLRDRGARMAAVIDTALEGIITIDERGIVESLNPAALELFGYQAEEIIGRNVNMLMPEPARGEHDGYLMNYLSTGKARIIGIGREVSGQRKDGSIFPLHLGVSEFMVGGRRMYTGQVRDITERRRMEREILEIGAREQMRIGQDLHDGLCQELTGVSFALEVLGQKLAARSAPETESIRKVAELVDQSISHARALAHGLQPVDLDSSGLKSALRELASKTERVFHVSCLFVSEGTVLVHDNVVATHVYRIAQEAIGNSIKHGKAKTILLELTVNSGQLGLAIADDGIGLKNASGDGTGIGLQTMQYRARVVGGTLVVRPGERGGTVVACTVPLRPLESKKATSERSTDHGGETQTDQQVAQTGKLPKARLKSGDAKPAKAKGVSRRRPPDRPRTARGTDRPGK